MIKYRGILAKAGYNPKYKTEVSWEELKRSALLYKRLPMIVAGESHSGPIDPNEAIGHVDQVIDEENETIWGDYIFHKERFENIPTKIQMMLMHKQFIPASLGYEPFNDLRKYDHIAIGVDSPVFKDVGFHAESNFRYEETEGINKPEKEAEAKESVPEETKVGPGPSVTLTAEQFSQLLERLTPQPPAPQVTEEVKEEEPTEEPQPEAESEVPEPVPEVEPERTLPMTSSTPKQGEWYEDEQGRRVMSIETLGGPKEKK